MSVRKLIILFLFISTCLSAQESRIISLEKKTSKIPFGLTTVSSINKPRIGLALSGGGARAISQIGVLEALRDNNIPINILVGTSMGSVIGGMYSSGYCLDEIDSILTGLNWEEFSSLDETSRRDLFVDKKITEDRAIFSLRFDNFTPVIPTSLNTGQKVLNFLNRTFINAPLSNKDEFDQLLFDFKAVATDLVSGKAAVLEEGSISKSLRASSSVSFLLPPVEIDSLTLVDGGLVANVPVEIAKSAGAELIIALNTTSTLREDEELDVPWNLADQVISIPMSILTRQQLDKADVVIQPYLGRKKNNDFSNLRNIIELGYEAAKPHLDYIARRMKKEYFENISKDIEFFKNVTCEHDSLAEKFCKEYSGSDSVSNYEIEYFLSDELDKGFYKDISAELIPNGDSWNIKIHSELNPVINEINISGITSLDSSYVSRLFSVLNSKPYNPKTLLNQVLILMRQYKSAGLSLARLDYISFDEQNGSLKIVFDEGIIDEIRIRGNKKTNSTVIFREFPFKEKQPLRYMDLAEGLENLRVTDLFDEINISIMNSGSRNVLLVDVKEKLATVLRFGLKIDNEYFTQFSFDLRNENIFGTGAEIGANFVSGPRNRFVTLEQKSSRIFKTYLTYSIKGFYNSIDINTYMDQSANSNKRFSRTRVGEYKQRNYGVSFGLGAQVKKFGNLFGEFIYHRDQIDNIYNLPVNEYIATMSSIKLGLKIDSQNYYPYPTAGVLVESFYETSQKFLNADVSYSKLFFDYNQYITINDLHTFRVRGLIGFADETLPVSQWFSFGGQFDFSGYREYDFRGRQILKSSIEYRIKLPFQIFFDTYFKGRYDLGSIWEEREKIKFNDLRHGISTSLSFNTPIGPADFSVSKSFVINSEFPENIISLGETIFYFNIGFYY